MPLSEKMKSTSMELINNSSQNNKSVVVKYGDESNGQFFSVYSGKLNYWSVFGRVVVSLKDNILRCPCSGSKFICVHKAAVKCLVGIGTISVRDNDMPNCNNEEDFNLSQEIEPECQNVCYEEIWEGADNDINEAPLFDFNHLELKQIIPDQNCCHQCKDVLHTLKATTSGKIIDQEPKDLLEYCKVYSLVYFKKYIIIQMTIYPSNKVCK